MSVCEAARKSLFWTPNLVPGSEYASWLFKEFVGAWTRSERKAGVLRPFELITAEEKIDSAFEAIQKKIKIIGLPPEKWGQMIKSFSSEKNVFAVMGENKNIIQY